MPLIPPKRSGREEQVAEMVMVPNRRSCGNSETEAVKSRRVRGNGNGQSVEASNTTMEVEAGEGGRSGGN